MSGNEPITFSELATERMRLRPLREGDGAAFVEYVERSREHLRPWSPRIPEGVATASGFQLRLEQERAGMREGRMLRLAGFLGDGAIAGLFTLNNIVRGAFECADAGWQVDAGHTGCGMGTEGVSALLDIAFAPAGQGPGGFGGLGLHRVQANVIAENAASMRVAEKCGFRREGVALRMLKIDGAWRDHVMHAKVSDEHERRFLK